VARSGSRLKVTWYQTADGVRTPIEGLFDSLLGKSCTPQSWSDSVTRCTPQYPTVDTYTEYSDANCTMPILESETPFPANTYLLSRYAGCGDQTTYDHLYTPGAELTLAHAYRKNGAECDTDSNPGEHFYSIVDAGASTLVTVNMNYDATGAVEQMHWDSIDGMQWYRPEGRDSVLGAECSYQQVGDSAGICDPRTGIATEYRDASCLTPQVDVPAGCTPAPYLRSAPSSGCANSVDPTIWSVGSLIPPGPRPLYVSNGGVSCTAQTANLTHDFYYVSTTQAGTLQPMTRAYVTGAARLQPFFLDTARGVHYQTSFFYDTMLGVECAFALTPGTSYCQPKSNRDMISYYGPALFSDSACTVPLHDVVQIDDNPGCALSPVYQYVQKMTGVGTFEFHLTGAQHTATVYQSTSTQCVRYPEIGIPQSWRIFDYDPTVVPTSAFVSASQITDP